MTLFVNGKPVELECAGTVADLLRQFNLHHAACAVEVNRRIVPKRLHAEQPLVEGDRVEIMTLVGGG